MMRSIPELPPGLWPALQARAGSTEAFVALARLHRLLPIAANDPALEGGLQVAARSAWEADLITQDAASSALDAHIVHIQSLLSPDDILYLKGVVFRGHLYPDRTLRAMDDIDLFVRPNHFAKVAPQLRSLGYSVRNHHYFHADGWHLPIDLISEFAEPHRHSVDHEEIFRERIFDVEGVPQLAPHHALATYGLLCGTRIHLHLRKILDLWLMSRDEAVLAEAAETARRWRMRRTFHASIFIVGHAFHDSGGEWRARISGASLTPSERRLVERVIVPASTFPSVNLVRTKLRRLALLDSHAMRLRFVAAHL